MSTVSVTVQASILKAICMFAAKQDIRYYLNGILVEFVDQDAYLVATNGHRLAAYHCKSDTPVQSCVQVIVPNQILGRIDARNSAQLVTITADENEVVGITQGGVTVSTKAICAKYPDWRRVIPRAASGEAAQFKPEYLSDISKIAKLVTGRSETYPHLWHNGAAGAPLDIGDENFLIVIMPVRDDGAAAYKAPDWAAEKLPEVLA